MADQWAAWEAELNGLFDKLDYKALQPVVEHDACKEKPTIAHGKANRIRSNGEETRFRFTCDYRYHVFGYKYVTCKRGRWSNPYPLCISYDCERPSIPQGVITESLRRNSVLTFSCEDGMVTEGRQEIYCADGKWSGPPPKCIHGSLPSTYCPFTHHSACGWLRGYSFFITWVLHPAGYVQTTSANSMESDNDWTWIDNLPPHEEFTSTKRSQKSVNMSRLTFTPSSSTATPSSSTSTPLSSTATTTVVTGSAASETRSSTSTIESYLSSADNFGHTPTVMTSSAVTIHPSSSSTNQPSSRRRKREEQRVTLPVRADLVSPQYPANYSGVCFRLSFRENGTIPLVFLMMKGSRDIYIEPQNITVHYLHEGWKGAFFEVPSVARPFQLVLSATTVGVGVKDVALGDVACEGNAKEEAPTTEPWLYSEETTDPGTTENWTSEPSTTTELRSTSISTTSKPFNTGIVSTSATHKSSPFSTTVSSTISPASTVTSISLKLSTTKPTAVALTTKVTPTTAKVTLTPSTPKKNSTVAAPTVVALTAEVPSATAKIPSISTTATSKPSSTAQVNLSTSSAKGVSTYLTSTAKTIFSSSNMLPVSLPISAAVNRSEPPRRIVPVPTSTPLPASTRRTPQLSRPRSSSTPKPTFKTTTPTFKSNQPIGVGTRFKDRTKFNITEATQSRISTTHASGVPHWEIAIVLIALVFLVGGLVWCLRKKFPWLRSSRMRLGDTYSLHTDDADDVILDTLPSSTSRKNDTNNGDLEEESSADTDNESRGKSVRFSGFNGSRTYLKLK